MTCRHEGVLSTETFVGVDGRANDHRFYLVSYRRSDSGLSVKFINPLVFLCPSIFFSKDDEYKLYWTRHLTPLFLATPSKKENFSWRTWTSSLS